MGYPRNQKTFEQTMNYRKVYCPSCGAKIGMPCVQMRKGAAVQHTHVTRRNKYRYDIGKMNEPILLDKHVESSRLVLMKQKLLVSVSGGKTSAFMAKKLRDEYADVYDMIFVFANTGEEWEETLLFVDRCDREWGLKVVWVEAVVHFGERKGCSHKVVNFASASRHGEPFEEIIKKYGIPNKSYPHCTRELKLNPIRSYAESIEWENYLTAVGIRSDEPSRVRKNAAQFHIIYPLVSMFPTDKPTINDFWEDQNFTLNLQDHQGNCKWCWKKVLSKHMRIARETPEVYEFPARMESLYGVSGHNVDGTKRVFFREKRSAKDIILLSEILNPPDRLNDPDEDSGCSESCEAFGVPTAIWAVQ